MPRALDIVRAKYVASPPWAKRMLSPLLSLLPLGVRWGATYRRYRADIARSQHDCEFVAAYRVQKLRELIALCAAQSPYYQSEFERTFGSNLKAETFTFDDLRRLPILDKSTVRAMSEKLLTKELRHVDTVSTSGSSGHPLKFYLDRDRGAKEWAYVHHIWGRIGFKSSDIRAVLRGVRIPNVDIKPWAFDAALGELLLSPFHLIPETMDKYLQLIARYGVQFLHGYPSAITILAAHAIRRSWCPPSTLKGVLPVSESLLPYQRDVIRQAFRGVPVLAFYGQSEKVAIAGELPDVPDSYEFEPLYGHTELVDDQGQPVVEVGRIGRVIGTGFISSAMPLLRYDMGDKGELVRLPSQDNCYRLRLRAIRSRWGQELLVGYNGALISIAAVNIHSAIYARIREFQFFQDRPGEVKVRVVPLPGYGKEDLQPFVDEIRNKVGASLDFHLELHDGIPANARGKRPFIDQRLDIHRYTYPSMSAT